MDGLLPKRNGTAIIYRYYLEFHDLIDPSRLAGIKQKTNDLEDRFSNEGQRRYQP